MLLNNRCYELKRKQDKQHHEGIYPAYLIPLYKFLQFSELFYLILSLKSFQFLLITFEQHRGHPYLFLL